MKRLSNSEIKARLIFVVGVTLSFVFGVTMIGILYSLVFVVQPENPSPNDSEMLSLLSPAFMALLGLLGGIVASNGLKDKGEKDND